MQKPELLAPAGSKDALVAAVENGADAVYFGGKSFSARRDAGLSWDELEWAVDYAHIRGVKAYVTVNTLVKDAELEEVSDHLRSLCDSGADAVIVQDYGILRLIREQLPGLPVHASTQMTIHSVEGVKFLRDLGVRRVVLARELTLDGIRKIKSGTNIEIETFVHGALCFSYSGQCLFSSMIGGRSGNRGYCAQPCRKKYFLNDATGYLLSPGDLNMSEHIDALMDAGIDSLKIEGRLKRPEYVAGVVGVYRRLIDRYFESPVNFRVSDNERHTLLQLFNRGFTTGYYFGGSVGAHPPSSFSFSSQASDLMSRDRPHNRGTYLGKVVDVDRRVVTILLEAPLRAGDGIGTEDRETGIVSRKICHKGGKVNSAEPGMTVKIPFHRGFNRDDTVFKTYDSRLMDSLKGKRKTIPLKMSITARTGRNIELRISDGDSEITIEGGAVSRARDSPILEHSIASQLKKLGDTPFEASEISFDTDNNIFIPVSELNSLRRRAVALFEKNRAQRYKRECKKPVIAFKKRGGLPGPILSVNTSSIECLEAAVDSGADVVYIGEFKNKLEKDEIRHAVEYGNEKEVEVYFSTPRIVKGKWEWSREVEPDGFLVGDAGVLYSLCRSDKPVVIDYPFNIFNKLTVDFLLDYGQRVTLSPELTLREISDMRGPNECIVHGFFPLMVSEHDLIRGLFPGDTSRDALLRDEKGFVFPVITDLNNHTYIMNSRELCMIDRVPALINAGIGCLRIEARTYDKGSTAKITRLYRKAIDGKKVEEHCSGRYTTGHYFRGVL